MLFILYGVSPCEKVRMVTFYGLFESASFALKTLQMGKLNNELIPFVLIYLELTYHVYQEAKD